MNKRKLDPFELGLTKGDAGRKAGKGKPGTEVVPKQDPAGPKKPPKNDVPVDLALYMDGKEKKVSRAMANNDRIKKSFKGDKAAALGRTKMTK